MQITHKLNWNNIITSNILSITSMGDGQIFDKSQKPPKYRNVHTGTFEMTPSNDPIMNHHKHHPKNHICRRFVNNPSGNYIVYPLMMHPSQSPQNIMIWEESYMDLIWPHSPSKHHPSSHSSQAKSHTNSTEVGCDKRAPNATLVALLLLLLGRGL